ncbi:hypothetical protein [Plantibacter sp. CFBP 8804]|uniref:hypothetical protein n=1 Tax=Plantibacter sp. CFBP 8804 TaxID=2775270 RepID=UPI00177F884D|nr:hypothetical protein [Plantibacter sp. CFBP 8804]MBD8517082.1 hypothetical protein [Plantibacter sp. CFBP 8804]
MNDRDATIGRNLAALRGDMPQKTLADLMREAGWKWSQATVWSVEKGERPLKLAEAEYLTTNIFNTQPFALLGQEWESLVQSSLNELTRSRVELSEVVTRYVTAQRMLAARLDMSSDEDAPAARGKIPDHQVAVASKYLAESPQEAARAIVQQILSQKAELWETIDADGQALDGLRETLRNG